MPDSVPEVHAMFNGRLGGWAMVLRLCGKAKTRMVWRTQRARSLDRCGALGIEVPISSIDAQTRVFTEKLLFPFYLKCICSNTNITDMRITLLVAICVLVGVDILLADHVWGIMKTKGFVRDEFSAPSSSR